MKSKRQPHGPSVSPAKLDEMIEEATVDAYGESEETVGFFTLLEERLKLPFKTPRFICALAADPSDRIMSV